MTDNMNMYIRKADGTPIGAMKFINTGRVLDGLPVVAVGWSKAMKSDTFVKKIGTDIATKRAIKSEKWINTTSGAFEPLASNSQEFYNNASTLPFIVKDNIDSHFATAKIGLGIEGSVIFIVPVVEKFADFKDFLNKGEGEKLKVRSQTRYIKVLN